MSKDDSDNTESKDPSRLSETLKKVFTAGVSAAFMTEESVRAYLAELKLPKELLNVLLQGAQKSKDEIVGRVTNEMVTMIKKIDFVNEFSKFAENHKFKVSAEIEIIKKESKSKPHSEG